MFQAIRPMVRYSSTSSLQDHLAAISPYNNVYKQPPLPTSKRPNAAVYLFRHGILEVSHHDYSAYIKPFLEKLHSLQTAGTPFVQRRLSFLSKYESWITEAHVGMISPAGLKQSSELGKTFRARYSQWLKGFETSEQKPTMQVWTDSAARCRLSAIAFSEGFSGITSNYSQRADDLFPEVDAKVEVLSAKEGSNTCDNLCWHTAFSVDQEAGHEQMMSLMKVTTKPVHERLGEDWLRPAPLSPKDIYAMQLLHCYDTVAKRPSPFTDCFESDDWAGFEYLRDTKYYFSEGYGAKDPGFFATPWMKAAMTALMNPQFNSPKLPLQIAFSHREEVLYLCCLLGINFTKGWIPDLTRVDKKRRWRASLLAPYLGHIGLETYNDLRGKRQLRLIVNGSIASGFFGEMKQDKDGGYDLGQVCEWTEKRFRTWQDFSSSTIDFIT